MAIAIALLGFNDLRVPVTSTFLLRKKKLWEDKKNYYFCSVDIDSWHNVGARRVKVWSFWS